MSATHLKNISEIRRFFHRNERPIYFVSGTNYNLLGIDEWVRNFKNISYIDCYDGRHPNTFVPGPREHEIFESIEDINKYLLQHPEVIDYVRGRGGDPVFVFLMFDVETERLVEALGGEIWFPKSELRESCDDKIKTVRIGNDAGVPSVPNVLSEVTDWNDLCRIAKEHDLGEDFVVQSAFGDSGETTFFISSEKEFAKEREGIVGQGEMKIMKRIDCRASAIEACTTASGTLVGPLMTELVGFEQLTPHKGGWCGNEIFSTAFSEEVRQKARDYTFKFGEQLRKTGYRGYFELDFLIDRASDEVWLGELNPRIAGTTSMTNHAAFAHADAPLFLFHLLEFSGATFDIDIDEINARWSDADMIDDWSQMIIKHTGEDTRILTAAPYTGIYRMDADGNVVYDRFDYHRRAVEGDDEAFFLRILKAGDYHYEGADLGILVARGRMMTDEFRLTPRAEQWAAGIKALFASAGGEEEVAAYPRFKLG